MLAIIGGTGLYEMQGMAVHESRPVATPFGMPSADIVRGRVGGREILFLARHGAGHRLLPHEINYRANIFALKSCGATHVLGISAVGSLREEIAPGELVVASQYIDWTRGRRENTFFGNGVAVHVSTATPVSAAMVQWIAGHARRLGISLHTDKTYGCVDGPRLGTRAESHLLRQSGCDLVGMTNVPEVFLAREAQLCYATIGITTDYDCWMDDPARHVSVAAIFSLYQSSLERAQAVLAGLLLEPLPVPEPDIRSALAHAMLTPVASLTPAQREWLAVLQR